jgi:hypothetical protein
MTVLQQAGSVHVSNVHCERATPVKPQGLSLSSTTSEEADPDLKFLRIQVAARTRSLHKFQANHRVNCPHPDDGDVEPF